MASESRHHHYIPQCYLRGFGIGSGKHCKLTVGVLDSYRWFSTNPRNVAGVRDFNKVSLDGVDADALEKQLALFESEVATALREVSKSHAFDGESKIVLLNFIALLSLRSPQQRECWSEFENRVLKKVMTLALASKERWESQLRQAGITTDSGPTYEEIKKFHQDDEYTFKIQTDHHIGLELGAVDTVLETLIGRKWRLILTDDSIGCFITSDQPVTLDWLDPTNLPPLIRRSPGHGLLNTVVGFPLSRHLFLFGVYEGVDETIVADASMVALLNTSQTAKAFQQIYAPKKTFPYLAPDKTFRHDNHLLDVLEACGRESRASQIRGEVDVG